jgi:predicted site-specific integrase-resolvase
MSKLQAATGADTIPDETMQTEQAAAACGVAIRTLLVWRKNGTLPQDCRPIAVPGVRRLRWPAAELRRFAAGRRQTQGGDHA